jgi:hypothetical protein
VKLSVETDYPWKGHVRVVVTESPAESWVMKLRVPGWNQCARFNPQSLGRAPEQGGVTHRIRRREQYQPLGRPRQLTDAPDVVILDVTRQVFRGEELKATGQLGRVYASRQLEQREGITTGLGDDPVADARVEQTRHAAGQQRKCVLVSQAFELQLRQVLELPPAGRLSNSEHDPYRLGQQPARDESKHLIRSLVEPVRVINETEQWLLLGHGGQQAEYGEGDEEPVRSTTGRPAQRDAQRILLGLRKSVETGKHRRAQLMDTGERQLHLGLDTCDLRDTKVGSLSCGVPQQGGLSDASLATDDEDSALTLAHVRQQPVEHFALASPAQESWSTVGGHRLGSLNETTPPAGVSIQPAPKTPSM